MEKTTREKIQALKAEVDNPGNYENLGDDTDIRWQDDITSSIPNWKYHFYGSGDPADYDEAFIRHLSEFCFRSVGSLTDIVSDLNQSVERLLLIREIGNVLVERPELMKVYENLRNMDEKDVVFMSDLSERLAAKETSENGRD